MKKIILCSCVVLSLILFTNILMAADEKVEIVDAFRKGLVSITVTGLASGELVELKLKRLTTTSLIILINKGRTDIGGKISVFSDEQRKIDLTDDNTYEAVILKQTGAYRFTRGPLTLVNEN